MPKNVFKNRENLKHIFILLFSLFILLLVFSNLIKYIYNNNIFVKNEAQVLGVETDLKLRRDYWNKLLETHPDYFPGWVELVEIELEFGKVNKANKALQKAIELNPNSLELITLISRVDN